MEASQQHSSTSQPEVKDTGAQLPPPANGEQYDFTDLMKFVHESNQSLAERVASVEAKVEARPSVSQTPPPVTAAVPKETVKEAVKETIEEEGKEAARGIRNSAPVRFGRWMVEPLIPKRPTKESVRNGVVLTGVELTVARYVPVVRNTVISVITP